MCMLCFYIVLCYVCEYVYQCSVELLSWIFGLGIDEHKRLKGGDAELYTR